MKKRVLSLCLALCLLVGCLPLAASAASSGNCGPEGSESSVTWSLSDEGTLTVSGSGPMKSGPGDWTSSAIKSVVIDKGVTSVGGGAFNGCTALTSLTLSDSVTSIGMSAFGSCSGLTTVTFPKSVASVGMGAFGGCSGLKNAIFMGNAPQVEYLAFSGYADGFCIYFADDATGWNSPTWTSWAQNTYPCKPLSQMNPDVPGTPDKPSTPDKPDTPATPDIPAGKFTDVPIGAYYYDAVQWAVEKKITAGTSETEFSPGQSCTRGQAVTFLWRAAGEPEPTNMETKFTDVRAGAYYEKAVKWAVEQGITTGVSATKFSPDATCTRAQIVTFLWRNEGSPAVMGSAFDDVKAGSFYEDAVKWAAQNDITTGTGKNTFSPDNRCVRAQIVTFLYRYAK